MLISLTSCLVAKFKCIIQIFLSLFFILKDVGLCLTGQIGNVESVQYCEETKGLLKVCSCAELRLYLGSSVSMSMLTLKCHSIMYSTVRPFVMLVH